MSPNANAPTLNLYPSIGAKGCCRQNPVDQPTLAIYFETFGLTLEPDNCLEFGKHP